MRLKRVAVDLTAVVPAEGNGGAKVLATSLVRLLSQALETTEFVLLTNDDTHDELAALDSGNVRRVCIVRHGTPGCSIISRTKLAVKRASAALLPPALWNVLRTTYRSIRPVGPRGPLAGMNVDLLFCPFTGLPVSAPSFPVVAVVYDLQHLDYPQFFTPEERRQREANLAAICRHATQLITISDYVRKTVLERLSVLPERVTTIHIRLFHRLERPSPAATAAVLDHLGLTPGRFLLYPANFWAHKNHRMLVTAFGRHLSRHPDTDLKLVCTGGLDVSADSRRDAGALESFGGRILLPGYVPDERLAALLQSCTALIFPSLYEGFGMPVLEAMACGRPVLCSNVGSLPEVASDAALFFDPTKPAEIADAIERIESDAGLAAELIRRGRERLAAFGDPGEMVQEYLQVFRRAVR